MQSRNLVRSIIESQKKPIEAIVKGNIPEWVNGTLFRNGGGRYRFGHKVYKHLFDGMACINKFEIHNKKVFYSNRLLDTKTLRYNKETNNCLYAMFGTPDPCTTIFKRFKMLFVDKEFSVDDNVNINVVPYMNNQLYALTETNILVQIDPKTLDVINTGNILKHLKGLTVTSSAHPHMDTDGGWLNVGIHPNGPAYDFLKYDAKSDAQNVCEGVRRIGRLPSSHFTELSYFHSFGLTKNYIVFLEQSLMFDLKIALSNAVLNKPVSNALRTDKNFKTKIHLINRFTGEIHQHKFYTDPQFTFHHINAYENDNKEIIADLCSYDAVDFHIDNLSYDEKLYEQTEDFLQRNKAYAKRLRIPLSNLKQGEKTYVKLEDINNQHCFELATINYGNFNTKRYSYAYGIDVSKKPYKILKLDVNKYNHALVASIHDHDQISLPGEPVFIPRPNATEEDDGVVLSLVLGEKYDYLLVLDGKTLKEVARAELPETVKATFTFHGFFADNKTYKALN